MPDDKPIHIPRAQYPEPIYPANVSTTLSPPEFQEQSINLLNYWHIVVARRWTVLALLLTVVSITMIATFQQTPIYRAQATIQIDRENPNILAFKGVYDIESVTDDTLQTQYKVLAARTMARRVIEELKLDQDPRFALKNPGLVGSFIRSLRSFLPSEKLTTGGDENDKLRPFVDSYIKNLDVTPVTRSRLATIAFESEDPRLAATVINEHAVQFIKQNLQYKYEATLDASDFLSKQIVGLKGDLEKSEDKLQEYSRANQILFTQEGQNTATEKLRQMEEEHTKAQGERIQKQAVNSQVRAGRPDSLPQLLTNPLIAELSAQAADLRRQEANLAVTFQPEYPSRQRIRSQIEGIDREIANEKSRVINTSEGEFSAAVEREKLIAQQLEQQKALVNQINQQIIQYNIQKREVESNKQLYDGLLTRLKEAQVSAGLNASNIRVVDRAEIPRIPVSPRKGLNLVLSLILGLGLGVGMAVLLEYLDNTLKSQEDVARFLQMPTLAVVPKLASVSGSKGYRYAYRKDEGGTALQPQSLNERIELIIHTSPTSIMAEAYRSLRTSLLLSAADHAPRTVLVTSSVPSEGKTSTASNLAISLTQTGARTLLIDGDMRKPRIHTIFELDSPLGLSNFLTGSVKLQEVIHECQVPNLFVIPCGAIPPNPGELILSDRFNRMMEAVREYFDYVIIDSPPLSHVSDGRVLANVCEAALIVVKSGMASRHIIRKAVDELSGTRAHLAGVVLNDVDVRSGSYSDGYYSGYNRYGYSYSSRSA